MIFNLDVANGALTAKPELGLNERRRETFTSRGSRHVRMPRGALVPADKVVYASDMALRYPPFQSCSAMLAASRDAPALRWGARGSAVRLLQAGLSQLGFPLPYSTLAKGIPDGVFGDETAAVLRRFQEKCQAGLKVDGIAGRQTIAAMDAELASTFKKSVSPAPPRPRDPMTIEYQLGTADPIYVPDPGAGAWNSVPRTATYAALGATIIVSLPLWYGVLGDDAVWHMAHFFANNGATYTIDLEGMVRDVPSANELYEDEVAQAKQFVELLQPGRYDITSRQTQEGYNYEEESKNWYFAIGGYHVWGQGVAVVTDVGGERTCELDFVYKFRDRYNWDGGKHVTIRGQVITDEFMAEFHRQGIAQEFDCVGSFARRFGWKAGQPIPRVQLHQSSGRV